MAQPLRHLAAIRARIINSPDVAPLLGQFPSGERAVYLSHIFHIVEPVYPCVTLTQMDGRRAVWAPRLIDPCQVQIDCYARGDDGLMKVATIYDFIVDLLHNDKTRVSTSEACFHEIRQVWEAIPFWDEDTNAWRASARYLVRVSTH